MASESQQHSKTQWILFSSGLLLWICSLVLIISIADPSRSSDVGEVVWNDTEPAPGGHFGPKATNVSIDQTVGLCTTNSIPVSQRYSELSYLTKSRSLREIETYKRQTFEEIRNNTGPQITQRIVGGQRTEIAEFPWQVGLANVKVRGNVKSYIFLCGGAIIVRNFVLSAAHCTHKRPDPTTWNAVAGMNTTKMFTTHTQIREIYIIIEHNGFEDTNYDNDITLFMLRTSFTFDRYVQPICIPYIDHDVIDMYLDKDQTDCYVSGYGYTSEGGVKSGSFMSLKIPIVERNKCNDWFSEATKGQAEDWVLENQRCAGFETGGRDACQGDSGGPLSCIDKTKETPVWYLSGVVSWGIGCAEAKKPGVYTRLENYYDWVWKKIEANL